MFGKGMGRFAIAAAAMCAMAPANAASFVFTTASSSALSGAAGNSITLPAVSGITVTATAWSVAGIANTDLPTAGYLGRYGSGLGVTNGNEGNGATNNAHTIDNVGSYDFVRLVFSTAVRLTGLTLTGFDVDGAPASVDTDAWVSYGTGTNAFNTSALWGGYITRGVDVASGNAASFSSANFSTVWLIAAARSSVERNDGFKLGAVNAVVPQVPEPATWLTMILGFGMMGSALRRRATPALLATAA